MLSYSSVRVKKEIEKSHGQVWIKNKKVYVKNEKGLGIPPAINPCPGVNLIINGEQCNHLVIPHEDDLIEIVPETITKDELVEVSISDDKMEAILHTKPAKLTKFEILDSEPSNRIDIRTLEVIENIRYIPEDKVYKLLGEKGINFGIIDENIKSACSTYEEKFTVVARGTQPFPAKDAWIEYFFYQEKFEINLNEDENGRVDFRNFTDYKSSNVGDVLAIKHFMEPGVNGITVTGKEVNPAPPKDVALCAGNGVIIEDEGKLARCIKSGKSIKQASGNSVIININEKLEINSDVDIKIGNVKFKGNVIVNKNVKEAMEVVAKGDIFVQGDCHFAMIKSGNNVAIKGNIISSKVEAGSKNIIIRNPGEDINPIVESINTIISEIELSCGGTPVSIVYPDGITAKVKEILNSKCRQLPQDIYSFIIALKSNQYDCMIEKASEVMSCLKVFLGNCNSIKDIDELYRIKSTLTGLTYYAQDERVIEGNIILTYAANSDIIAKGCIKIGGKGCFNCYIRANDRISISGVVRGSEIHSEKMVEINQVGSEMGVPTTISVPEKGIIKIKKIYNDNIIKVGAYTYRFIEPQTDVYARIVDGKLIIS